MIADPLRPLPFGAVGSVHLLGLKAATILPRKLMMVLRTVAVVAAQQADPKTNNRISCAMASRTRQLSGTKVWNARVRSQAHVQRNGALSCVPATWWACMCGRIQDWRCFHVWNARIC